MSKETSSMNSVIKHPGFMNLWVNQILVQLASNSLNFALIIWVFRLTGSNLAVSALLFAVYLPAVLFGLFAGVLVDVVDKKKIILIINLLLMLSFLSLVFFKSYYLYLIFIAFFVNTLAQFYTPAESSSIPLIVKKKQLMVANSLFSTTLYTTFLLGFGFAGPLIGFFGIDLVFVIEASLLALAFLLSFKFPPLINKSDKLGKKLLDSFKKSDVKTVRQVAFIQIRETLKVVRGNLPVLFSICIMSGVQAVIGVLAVLIPSFTEKVLEINATDISYFMIIPLGIGMICGAFLIGKLGNRISKRRLVGLSILITGLMFFMAGSAPLVSPVIKYLSLSRPLPFFYQPSLSTIMAIGSLLLGVCMVGIIVPSQTIMQQNTSEQVRGKVFAVLGVAMSGLSLLPVLFTGLLADLFGAMPIFIGMGGSIAILGLLALRPSFFFSERQLPYQTREFLGLGHWKRKGN